MFNSCIVIGYHSNQNLVLGSNTHVILRVADHEAKPLPAADFTKVLCYSGRTQEAVANVFQNVEERVSDLYFQQLLANQANLPAKDTPFRGYMLINREGGVAAIKDIQKVGKHSILLYIIVSRKLLL